MALHKPPAIDTATIPRYSLRSNKKIKVRNFNAFQMLIYYGAIGMKTLVCSHETDAWLSHHKVGFPERDNLLEELYPHLEFLSRNSQDRFGQIPIKIDFLRIVLELKLIPPLSS